MKTILFPTDFSLNALHAFRYARAMAQQKRAELILMYIYHLPLAAPINAFTSREHTLELIERELKAAAATQMKVYTDELDQMEDPYRLIIREGQVINEIRKQCEEERIDLVVIGTKGNTANRDFLTGSITAQLIMNTRTPLLAIPESAPIKPFQQIVYALDLDHFTIDDLEEITFFAEQNKAALTFLHLSSEDENKPSETEKVMRFIANHPNNKLHYHSINSSSIIEGLNSYMKDQTIDLLALCNHTKSFYERLFHKSITREMLLHSSVPLLVFSKEIHPVVFF